MNRLAALCTVLLLLSSTAAVPAAGAASATDATAAPSGATAAGQTGSVAGPPGVASVLDGPFHSVRSIGAVSVSPATSAPVALLAAVENAVETVADRLRAGGPAPLVPDSLPRPPDLLVLLAGYSRADDSDPLAHDTRRALVDRVREAPGSPLTAVGRALDVPRSTVRYHVRVLEREGLVTAETIAGRNRLFPADEDAPALAAALRRDGAGDLLRSIAADGPGSVTALAERLDRAPSTVSHHLSRLADDGLVERRDEGTRTTAHLAGPARDLSVPDEAFGADD